MAQYINSFIQGIMNKDLDERLLPEGVYRNALNIDVDTDEGSNIGVARNQEGNVMIADITPILEQYIEGYSPADYDVKTIGAVKYEANNLIYWLVNGFRTDDAEIGFNGIFEFNEINGVTDKVLLTTELSTLNFSRQHIVTGINYINGFLYWTDGLNPPRKINITRAKSYAFNDGRIADDINVIISPPLNPPKLTLIYDNQVTESNNISEKFLYFSYRYKYIDNQYSSMSPFSSVAFGPSEFSYDYISGFNKAMVNKFNTINIQYNTGGRNVKEIQLLMYDTRNTNISIIESFNKEDLNLSDNTFGVFTFTNNKTYTYLQQDQLTRLFDNVPLTAKAQDFIGNRIMYGNYTQFFDIKDSDNVNINVSLSTYIGYESGTIGNPIQTLRSDRDYEVGIQYLDNYGRTSTVLTCIGNTAYIPPSFSDVGAYIKVGVKNKAPKWATNYRFVIKQSKKEYYNIFPSLYYKNGQYRYFLINESDRDKIKVGGYIIFKATGAGITYSNFKYKVLELELKEANFLPGAYAGLYFKLKTKNQFDLDPNGSISTIYNDAYGTDLVYNNGLTVQQYVPVVDAIRYVEIPIYYGNNNGDILQRNGDGLTAFTYNGSVSNAAFNDIRFTIAYSGQNEIKYTSDISGQGPWTTVSLTSYPTSVTLYIGTLDLCKVLITSNPMPDDVWKLNIRSKYYTCKNYFNGSFLPISENNTLYTENASHFIGGGFVPIKVEGEIFSGDIIEITINDGANTNIGGEYTQVFTATNNFKNIEEWFNEDCDTFNAYSADGTNIGKKAIWFRRGYYPDGTNLVDLYGFNFTRISQSSNDTDDMFMIIKGGGSTDWNDTLSSTQAPVFNRLSGHIKITRTDKKVICETEPSDNVPDVYHEVSETYTVVDGLHKVLWDYRDYTYALINGSSKTNLGQPDPSESPSADDMPHNFAIGDFVYVFTTEVIQGKYYKILDVPNPYNIIIDLDFPGSGPVTPGKVGYSINDQDQNSTGQMAMVQLNNTRTKNSIFNAWSFGNGLESERIKDDWNATELQFSPRVSDTIEDYKEKHSENAVCYSGIYGINTGINKLNEFNLSLANFKYLKKEYGSIQRIYGRNTDMVVFQENKISKVLYEKNLLYDSIGGSQIASIPEVLGTQVAYPGEWGISKNPESFGFWADNMYWTDARRGAVLMMESDSIIPISSYGMKYYFRDLMMHDIDSQKLGSYDPHTHKYVLATNNIKVIPCDLSLSRKSKLISGSSFSDLYLFTILTNTSWELSLEDTGFGTNWIIINRSHTEGYGPTDVFANVDSSNIESRTVKIIVSYCSGKSQEFLLQQGIGAKPIDVTAIVFKHG